MPKMHDFVREILKDNDVDPREACWDCHGTWVIYHKYLERIADRNGIIFDAPQILTCDLDKRAAAICVTGHLGDRSAWSFGEATKDNNKNPYPLAMAEKRAKDRVILKLAGLSGHIYSEEEADVFKENRPPVPSATPERNLDTLKPAAPAVPDAPPPPGRSPGNLSMDDRKEMILGFFNGLGRKAGVSEIREATGLTKSQSSHALKSVVEDGSLIMTGQKSGTRYHLPGDLEASNEPPQPLKQEEGLHGEELKEANEKFRESIRSPAPVPQPQPPKVEVTGGVSSDDWAAFTQQMLRDGANFRDLRNVVFQTTGFDDAHQALQAGAITEETLQKMSDIFNMKVAGTAVR